MVINRSIVLKESRVRRRKQPVAISDFRRPPCSRRTCSGGCRVKQARFPPNKRRSRQRSRSRPWCRTWDQMILVAKPSWDSVPFLHTERWCWRRYKIASIIWYREFSSGYLFSNRKGYRHGSVIGDDDDSECRISHG